MSVRNSTEGSGTIIWDSEPTKRSIKEKTDAFVDGIQPHVTTSIKTAGSAVITAAATAGGTALKTSIGSACPVAAPSVNTAINASTGPVVGSVNQASSP